MTTDDDFQNELWDYVYGLLEAEEVRALEQRITSEPLVARAYAEVRLQADLVNRAARVETAPIILRHPTTPCASTSAAWSLPAARWTIGLATALLVAIAGATWWQCHWLQSADAITSRDTQLAAQQVRLVVSGPMQIQAHATNLFSVQATNLLDQPVATTVTYEVCDSDGTPLRHTRLECAESGATLALSKEDLAQGAYVNFSCPSDAPDQAVRYALAPAVEHFQTQVVTDRAIYQNGDTVYFRSVTLPSVAPVQEREFNVNFMLLPPHDSMPTLVATGLTDHGIGNGKLQIPENWAAGRYALVAQSTAQEFIPQVQWFEVQSPRPQIWNKELTFAKRYYCPGEAVEVKLAATDEQGAPAKELKLRLETKLNGEVQKLAEQQAQTDSSGVSTFNVELPVDAPAGLACVQVELSDGVQTESIAESFEVASSTPNLNADLAATSVNIWADMSVTQRVLAPQSSVLAHITNREPQAQLLLLASCRGATVGQTVLSNVQNEQNVEFALAPEVAGVVDVGLYDYRQNPPTLLAKERCYRPPQTFWNVAAQRVDDTTWNLQVTDEAQRPGEAILGVRVVTAVPSPDQTNDGTLADEYFFATDGPSVSAVNQDFRNGSPQSTDQIALLIAKSPAQLPSEQLGWGTSRLYTSGGMNRALAPTVQVQDNLAAIDARYQSAAAAWREANLQQLHNAAQFLVIGAIVLLLALTMLGVLRLAGEAKVWAPLMVSAAVVLFVGGQWLGVQVAAPAGLSIASRTQTPVIVAGTNLTQHVPLGRSAHDDFAHNPTTLGISIDGGAYLPMYIPTTGGEEVLRQHNHFFSDYDHISPRYVLPALRFDTSDFGAIESNQPPLAFYSFGRQLHTSNNLNWSFRPPLRAEYFGDQAIPTPTLNEYLGSAKFGVQWFAASAEKQIQDLPAAKLGQETLYWNPLLRTDKQGRAEVRFVLPPGDTPHHLIVDVHGQGRLGALCLPLSETSSAASQLVK